MGTITLGAISIYNSLITEMSNITTQQTVDNLLLDLRESEGYSDYYQTLSRLESIMTARNIPFERKIDDAAYYKKLLSQYTFPSYEQMKYRMLHIIMDKMDQYYSPEMYMKRTVDYLEDPKLGWDSNPVRLRILKQFIKEGNALKDTGIKGDGFIRKYVKKKNPALSSIPNNKLDTRTILENLDDGVFKPLDPENTATTPNQRKPEGTYGLLTICDDLAKGLFHKNGFTKKYLYYFGIVYGMKYYPEDNVEKYEKEKDIEAVLFEGYYVNNITRFLLDEYKTDKNGRYEKDPSGQGINQKNFRELIWLYYLNQDLTPAEKLKRSTKMIDDLKKSKPAGLRSYDTLRCKQLWPGYFLQNEETLLERIPNEFDCTDEKAEIPVQSISAQKTAFRVYRRILKELQKEGMTVEDCDYGMSLIVDTDILRSDPEEFLTEYPDITREQLENFLILIGRFNEFISYPYLKADSPEEMSRLTIMGLYYYLFVEQNRDMMHKESFEAVCSAFETQVNKYLEESFYPLFSIKNYFDILIAFAAFTAIN